RRVGPGRRWRVVGDRVPARPSSCLPRGSDEYEWYRRRATTAIGIDRTPRRDAADLARPRHDRRRRIVGAAADRSDRTRAPRVARGARIMSLWLRDRYGSSRSLPLDAWFAPASLRERGLLADLRGPVLDLGCGPGRLVVALGELGI